MKVFRRGFADSRQSPGPAGNSWETARMDSAAYAQAKGHFWWWQVQDSNLGRRSRRFYREPLPAHRMSADLRILHSSPRESRVLSVWRP